MPLLDFLNKQQNRQKPNNFFKIPKKEVQQMPIFNDDFQDAKNANMGIQETADIKINDRPKKPKFDIGNYGESRLDMIEALITLKPSHNNARKVMKKYVDLILEEDIF